jgi:hypothetical protein
LIWAGISGEATTFSELLSDGAHPLNKSNIKHIDKDVEKLLLILKGMLL